MMIRSLKLFVVIAILAMTALILGCDPPGTGRTAIWFNNQCNGTVSFIIDGVGQADVPAGEAHTADVSPGQHTVDLLWADTGKPACSRSYPVVERGTTFGMRCEAQR